MPGKRPRPIRRTTSVSQLSSGLDPSPLCEERLVPPPLSALAPQQVTHSNNQNPDLLSFGTERAAAIAAVRQEAPTLESRRIFPVNVPDDDTIGGNTDESSGCEMMQNVASMMWVEDIPDAQSMAIDSVNESRSFSPPERSARRLQSVHSPSSTLIGARSEPFEVRRPVDLLDICFHCKRRLRLGRDIFMYRGDRFCSIECRCHQMAADEWREKCAVTAARKGGASPAVTSNTTNQVRPTETAAAA